MSVDKNKQISSEEIRTGAFATYWLSAIIESADDAIITKTLEGIITSWNHGAERLFGYTAAEVIGKSVTILIPPDHIDEEPQILARLKSGQRIDHYETVRVTKEGRLVDISLTVSPIKDPEGNTIGASKIARDITDRKRNERQLVEQAEIIEAVNRMGQTLAAELNLHKLVQAVIDAATGITNARFGSFFYNLLNEEGKPLLLYALSGVSQDVVDLLPVPQDAEMFGPGFQDSGTVLLEDVRKDPSFLQNSPQCGIAIGDLSVRSYLAVPVVSRSGEVYGGLVLGHPEPAIFTERGARIVEGLAAQAAIAIENARLYDAAQKARSEAEQLYRKAQEASQLKDEFLATVSHELRNPLNSILGWSRMLRSGQLPEGGLERGLETIERNARLQAQLIEDLLDVSRIITGKLRMDVRPADPNLFIDAAIESVRPAADAKGVRIQKVFDTGVVSVPGDPARLQQVIWNLLSNAIKFTSRGGSVQVSIGTSEFSRRDRS